MVCVAGLVVRGGGDTFVRAWKSNHVHELASARAHTYMPYQLGYRVIDTSILKLVNWAAGALQNVGRFISVVLRPGEGVFEFRRPGEVFLSVLQLCTWGTRVSVLTAKGIVHE